ncbi:MAG: MFS transporter [Mycobacteriales bacterium]
MRPAEDPRRGLALTAICMALALTMLDATTVSVILPSLRSDLQVGVTGLQWIVASYVLVFAALMLTGGTLGDLFGRRRLLLGGVATFVGGSLISALAGSVQVLYAGRVVQGIGAAACEPGTLSLIRQLFPEQGGRARAIGLWAGVSGLALAAGPIIGGLLVQAGSWRFVFWLNVALGGATLVAAARLVPESRDPVGRRVDAGGQVLGAAALALLTFALIRGQDIGFASPLILGAFAATLLATGGFIHVERRQAAPALQLRFFRNRAFLAANVVAFAVNFAIFAVFLFLSLYLQLDFGLSGLATAARFAPMSLAMILAAPLSGRWVARAGPGWPLALGLAGSVSGVLALFIVIDERAATAFLLLSLALLGLGLGAVLPPITNTVMTAVPAARSGMAAAVTNLSRQVGAVVGVAVLGAIVDHQLTVALVARLARAGVPADYRQVALTEVTTGRLVLPLRLLRRPGAARLIAEMLHTGKLAFEHGMELALLTSAAVITAAGLLALSAAAHGDLATRPSRDCQVGKHLRSG